VLRIKMFLRMLFFLCMHVCILMGSHLERNSMCVCVSKYTKTIRYIYMNTYPGLYADQHSLFLCRCVLVSVCVCVCVCVCMGSQTQMLPSPLTQQSQTKSRTTPSRRPSLIPPRTGAKGERGLSCLATKVRGATNQTPPVCVSVCRCAFLCAF